MLSFGEDAVFVAGSERDLLANKDVRNMVLIRNGT